MLVLLAVVTSSCEAVAPQGSLRFAVIDGAESPEDLGFEIDGFHRDAVVAQIATVAGDRYQGCSGTIVGDRLVVVAGHCVVMNQEEWINSGAEPELIDASMLSYFVGDDIDNPDCELQAEEVNLNPEIAIGMFSIVHDMALIELSDSVLETCPQVLPIAINQEPITDEMVGAEVLQGGFGSTDGSYDFSPIRYWSLMELTNFSPSSVTFADIGEGFPTYGDSGSGALHRFPDGVVRNLGVASSSSSDDVMRFSRLDTEVEFLDDVLSTRLVCGASAAGICRDSTLLTCDGRDFQVNDCAAEGRVCRVEFGAGICVCNCDEEGPYCDGSCACDPDCPCECDASDGCDEGCDCDMDCAGGSEPNDDPENDGDDGGGCGVAGPRPSPLALGALLRP
jgi:hypothetical protein